MPTTGTVSGATGVISTVLLSAVVVPGGGMRSGLLLDLAIGCAIAVLAAAGWRLASTVRYRAVPAPPAPSGLVRPPLGRVRLAGFSAVRLRVDPISCTGHGLCAELLPELIAVDQWRYRC
jgi:hypothetical protein